jgi:hypothetical protein
LSWAPSTTILEKIEAIEQFFKDHTDTASVIATLKEIEEE